MTETYDVTANITEPQTTADTRWQAKLATSVEDAVMAVVRQRAGRGPVARFGRNELAARAYASEDEVHAAIEELAKRFVLGAESHPEYVIVVDAIPEYQGPPPEPLAPRADMRVVTTARRNGRWTSQYVPVDSNVRGLGAKVGTDGWADE